MENQNLQNTPINLPKHTHKILWAVLGVLLLIVIVGSVYWWRAEKDAQTQVCIQVVTTAKNPQTNEVKNFGTPCEVPEGWVEVKELNVVVYFKDKTPETEVIEFKGVLEKQSWAKSVDYLSAQENLNRFKEQHKDSPALISSINEIDENPFGAILTVHLSDPEQNETATNFIKSQDIYSKVAGINSKKEIPSTNWKTYSNTEYGFEFKYPGNLFTEEDEELFTIKSSPLSIDVIYNGGGITPEGVEGKDWVKGYIIGIDKDEKNISLVSEGDIHVDKWDVPNVDSYIIVCECVSVPQIVIKNPNKESSFVSFAYSSGLDSKEQNSALDKTFNQILSTFKFTGSTVSPSALKIENDKLVFEVGIHYGLDLEVTGGTGSYHWQIIQKQLPESFGVFISCTDEVDPCDGLLAIGGGAYPSSVGTNYFIKVKVTSGIDSITKTIPIEVIPQ